MNACIVGGLLCISLLPLPALGDGEPIISEPQVFVPFDINNTGYRFGWDVAIEDAVLVGGAPGAFTCNFEAGAAYVYELDQDGDWAFTRELLPSGCPLQEFDNFGDYVSTDGEQIIAAYIRKAYIFERTKSGGWPQTAGLDFGFDTTSSVAIDDTFAMAGDRNLNQGGKTNAGGVRVYRNDDFWTFHMELEASDSAKDDMFGNVAVDGDRLVVGTDIETGNEGAIYVFERNEFDSWIEVARVPSPFDESGFGRAVALSGDQIVVGSRNEVHFIARQPNGTWLAEQKINVPDAEFGFSVATSGDRALVGAPEALTGDDVSTGAAYLYEKDATGTWMLLEQLVPPDGAAGERYGHAVAMDGPHLVVGAPQADVDGDFSAGTVFLYEVLTIAPQIEFAGSCPGPVTVTIDGLTPQEPFEIYLSPATGDGEVPTGDCAGTPLGLATPIRVATKATESGQGLTAVVPFPELLCGRYLQLVDVNTCLTSDVAQVP